MNISSGGFTSSYLLRDLIRGIIILPVWWYTIGFSTVISGLFRNLKAIIRSFGLDIWMKNLFVPMYGETAFTGKLISFGIRFFMIIFQSIGVILWAIILLILLAFYILALPISVFGILFYGFGMLF